MIQRNRSKIKKELDLLEKEILLLKNFLKEANSREFNTTMQKALSVAMGSALNSVYGGYERIFETCLEDKGIKIAKSERWHTKLLENATEQNIAPLELEDTLKGMLSSRHRQIHGYGHDISDEIIQENATKVVESFPIFESHVNSILEERENLTVDVQKIDEKTITMKCGNKILPVLMDKLILTPASEQEKTNMTQKNKKIKYRKTSEDDY